MKIHMVKSGETMYNIAQKYGVSLEQLIAFNPQISNPDQLDVGMKVKIPSAAAHSGSSGVEYAHKHTVVQGDSLWKIAKAWGLPLKALIDANPQLKNPSVLLTGEIVNIPSGSAANLAPNMPNATNNISPAYVPPMNIAPLPQAIVTPPPIAAQQPIIAPPPTPKPVEQILQPTPKPVEQILQPTPKPVEQIILQPTPKPVEQILQPESKHPVNPESNPEIVSIHTSESLFMQFDVPAVEAEGKVEEPQSYQLPPWNAADMPQWEHPLNFGAYEASDYSAKPDCGCGGNAITSYDTNAIPYNPNISPFDANIPYNSDIPYNSYPTPYSSMPTYYIPQPMLAYAMQPLDQHAPMQFPASAAPASPFGYMVPCYPMGAYGDMGYLHGMQTPYSPWVNSNENLAPNQTLTAESSNIPPNNEQENGVVGISQQELSSKKRTKIPSRPTSRTSQKPDSRAVLHDFLQKKSNHGEPIRENKIKEPWMNR
ncbi:MAG: LysM peptidoglycan-binding domain-containing protein [Paenibacillaceae bacterium]